MLEDLPESLLYEILLMTTNFDDRVMLTLVSKHFYRLVNSKELWENMVLTTENLPNMKTLKGLPRNVWDVQDFYDGVYYYRLRKLWYNDDIPILLRPLIRMAGAHMTSLNVSACTSINQTCLMNAVVEGSKFLKNFEFTPEVIICTAEDTFSLKTKPTMTADLIHLLCERCVFLERVSVAISGSLSDFETLFNDFADLLDLSAIYLQKVLGEGYNNEWTNFVKGLSKCANGLQAFAGWVTIDHPNSKDLLALFIGHPTLISLEIEYDYNASEEILFGSAEFRDFTRLVRQILGTTKIRQFQLYTKHKEYKTLSAVDIFDMLPSKNDTLISLAFDCGVLCCMDPDIKSKLEKFSMLLFAHFEQTSEVEEFFSWKLPIDFYTKSTAMILTKIRSSCLVGIYLF
jgi:hypothetical protein